MTDAVRAAEVLEEAAQLNRDDSLLNGGCLLEFPDYGQLVMTGDLHGHRRNFERLQHYCDLAHAGARHVVLHEMVHEDVTANGGVDRSFGLLVAAAQWKCDYPDQVHFLHANHELAQLTGHEITKNGRVVAADFEAGVAAACGAATPKVLEAVLVFIRSLPLAGRTANRVFVSHSVPGPRDLPLFDPAILRRPLSEEDLRGRGSVHAMVWGRHHTEACLRTLAELLDADYFICGHQPQETGYAVRYDRMVILASEHNHGVFLPFDLRKPVTIASLTAGIRPLAAIA